ncbi:MAG: FAD-dependent oxidoreductase [Candidatus Flemingibacterium sp.]|nr:FAD-dependent oxidoreductase [Candidatus Flemingibacterium sp.]
MQTYHENAKELPIAGEYDVIVAGSGPAGTAAAVMAGRMGAKVLIIEWNNAIGGISTSGMMSHWTGSVTSPMYTEILQRSADMNEGEQKGKIQQFINPENLKTVYLDMLKDANVDVLLYTFVCGVVMEGDQLTGVITESKSGRRVFRSKVVVDGTGDGDVAAFAGVEYHKGRESDGKMQPTTLMFKVAGVDMSRAVLLGSFESTYQTEKGELQALAKEHIPYPAGHLLAYKSTLPGIVTCNMTNCTDIDGTKAEDLTRAEIVCRSQMPAIVKYLREFVPGFENCYIISAGSMMGVRETRHFKGVYTLNENDILTAKVFDDWVVRGAHFNFDVHNMTGSGLDATGVQKHWTQPKGYTIPYGCLVPEKINGLLLSGRNISGTHIAHSNYRVMPICVGIGAAAGAAAAAAIKKGIQVRDIKGEELQDRL